MSSSTKAIWNSLGSQGETYADTGYQNTWEVTRAQPGTAGVLVDYTGGNIGASFGTRHAAPNAPPSSSGRSSRSCRESPREWNGLATMDYWKGYQWTKGSYSYWKVGQYTKFAGAEGEEQDGCHFAGEHTSIDFQGYLNGGVESGERAAAEIVAALK